MFTQEEKNKLTKIVVGFIGIISILLVVHIVTGIKEYRLLGTDKVASNVITVTGNGEAFAVPDVAKVSFTIHTEAKSMDAAQKTSAEIYAKVKDAIKPFAIEEKNIKTENYNATPKYEWKNDKVVACSATYCPPSNGRNVLVGYTIDQTVSIKLQAVDKAGELIDALGTAGVSNISGPEYTVSDEDGIKAQARKDAIAEAKAKAEVLAKDLGVHLVRIVNFSESNGGGYPMPMYGAMDMMVKAGAPTTELPKGETKVTSDVSITYEIR